MIGCSQSRISYCKKLGKRQNYNGNGRSKSQTKPSKVICPYCWTTVAPYERQKETSKGTAHYNCALVKAIERLEAIGLPRPSAFSLGENFQNYLAKQAEILLWQPIEDVECKFAEILDISDELLGNPIQLSTLLMDTQSQGISP